MATVDDDGQVQRSLLYSFPRVQVQMRRCWSTRLRGETRWRKVEEVQVVNDGNGGSAAGGGGAPSLLQLYGGQRRRRRDGMRRRRRD